MFGRKSPQELFPNLFAERAATPAAPEKNPLDMRLLQYVMRKTGTPGATLARPALAPPPRPTAGPGRLAQRPAAPTPPRASRLR